MEKNKWHPVIRKQFLTDNQALNNKKIFMTMSLIKLA